MFDGGDVIRDGRSGIRPKDLERRPAVFPLLKTLQTLTKAKLLGVIALCAVLAVCLVVFLVALLTWLAAYFVSIQTAWLDILFNTGFGLAMGVGGWFMLPVFTVLIAGFFQEKVIRRVEAVYYPEARANEAPDFTAELMHDIRFTVYALFLNIIVLPLYLIGIGYVIAVVLNGYLLGREFFESVAGYHVGKNEAWKLGRKNRLRRFIGGLVITVMTLTPVINLFSPIIGTVWMIHLYHGLVPEK
jgi:CysZ protein